MDSSTSRTHPPPEARASAEIPEARASSAEAPEAVSDDVWVPGDEDFISGILRLLPQEQNAQQEIILLFDVSGSMRDYTEVVKRVIAKLNELRVKGVCVKIVPFGGFSDQPPPQLDLATLAELPAFALESIFWYATSPDWIAYLRGPADLVILLTDGALDGGDAGKQMAAKALAGAGVPILPILLTSRPEALMEPLQRACALAFVPLHACVVTHDARQAVAAIEPALELPSVRPLCAPCGQVIGYRVAGLEVQFASLSGENYPVHVLRSAVKQFCLDPRANDAVNALIDALFRTIDQVAGSPQLGPLLHSHWFGYLRSMLLERALFKREWDSRPHVVAAFALLQQASIGSQRAAAAAPSGMAAPSSLPAPSGSASSKVLAAAVPPPIPKKLKDAMMTDLLLDACSYDSCTSAAQFFAQLGSGYVLNPTQRVMAAASALQGNPRLSPELRESLVAEVLSNGVKVVSHYFGYPQLPNEVMHNPVKPRVQPLRSVLAFLIGFLGSAISKLPPRVAGAARRFRHSILVILFKQRVLSLGESVVVPVSAAGTDPAITFHFGRPFNCVMFAAVRWLGCGDPDPAQHNRVVVLPGRRGGRPLVIWEDGSTYSWVPDGETVLDVAAIRPVPARLRNYTGSSRVAAPVLLSADPVFRLWLTDGLVPPEQPYSSDLLSSHVDQWAGFDPTNLNLWVTRGPSGVSPAPPQKAPSEVEMRAAMMAAQPTSASPAVRLAWKNCASHISGWLAEEHLRLTREAAHTRLSALWLEYCRQENSVAVAATSVAPALAVDAAPAVEASAASSAVSAAPGALALEFLAAVCSCCVCFSSFGDIPFAKPCTNSRGVSELLALCDASASTGSAFVPPEPLCWHTLCMECRMQLSACPICRAPTPREDAVTLSVPASLMRALSS